jgi:hypothetical protein
MLSELLAIHVRSESLAPFILGHVCHLLGSYICYEHVLVAKLDGRTLSLWRVADRDGFETRAFSSVIQTCCIRKQVDRGWQTPGSICFTKGKDCRQIYLLFISARRQFASVCALNSDMPHGGDSALLEGSYG